MQLSKAANQALYFLNIRYSELGEDFVLTEEQIVSDVRKMMEIPFIGKFSEEEQDQIVRKLIALVGVVKMEDECIVNESEYAYQDPNWFSKLKESHNEWFTAYRTKLYQKEWSPNVIRELDKSSDAIMNFLGDPQSPQFNVRGLVMGDIQSGKTANFIALCNKAADAGYRVIIVTAGVIEKLRRQTQIRLEREFINLLPVKQVVKLTGATYDFRKEQGENPVHVFRNDVPVLCVVKKNVSVLQHLYKWLQKGVKKYSQNGDISLPWPLLFIDDEADNASINTKELSEEANPTRTNELIRKILKSFTHSSYVGITATPFANVFIDPDTEDKVVADDLFPKSFVYRLTTPSNYFGARTLFEEGSPYLRIIDDIELWLPSLHKKDEFPSEEIPESLKTAIGYFLLVNGVMDVMGESGEKIGHRSMMIHISRFVAIQNRISTYVEDYVKRLIARISNYCGDPVKADKVSEISNLHAIWNEFQLSRMCDGMQWRRFLKEYLLPAIKTLEVVSVNSGKTIKSLDYTESEKRVIIVGGNALSRGLTLEGLVVSYFRRNSMMSDTLLQMGRWCGYRGSWQSLVRVWMPQSAVDNFGYSSDISDELSDVFHQIVEQGGSPKDFAFKIRKCPGAMLPTARNKMRTATRVRFPVVLSGHAIETPRIKNDVFISSVNDESVVSLLVRNQKYQEKDVVWDSQVFYRNVPRDEIVAMLSGFKAGMMSYGFMIPEISEYIASLDSGWDIMFTSASDEEEAFSADGRLPIPLRITRRKLSVADSGREVFISGTKLKVTSGSAMRYILSPQESQSVVEDFRSNRGRKDVDPPDGVFLRKAQMLGKRPLLIIQYVRMSSLCQGSSTPLVDSFFALSFGFPGSKDAQLEQEFYFTKRAYEESSRFDLWNSEMEV